MATYSTITPDALADVVCQLVAQHIEENEQEIKKRVQRAGKACAEALRGASPKLTGAYAAGWTARTTTDADGAVSKVYNKAKPGLTHLLEFGHGLVYYGHPTGHRVRPYPHLDVGYDAGARELMG